MSSLRWKRKFQGGVSKIILFTEESISHIILVLLDRTQRVNVQFLDQAS